MTIHAVSPKTKLSVSGLPGPIALPEDLIASVLAQTSSHEAQRNGVPA